MTAHPPVTPPVTLRHRSLKTYLSLVKFEHTLFALPFAYGAMLLAADGWPGWRVFGLITLAMVGARTASMALNRVIDASIDAQNPRTASREIPSGKLSARDGWVLAVVGFAVLAVAGWLLNPLTLALLPVAVFFLALYPYTKRFTWLCHYWLGLTIGAAAAGGWIAVTGAFAAGAWLLWAAVGLWIAGFDIIYATLDYDFDKLHGIHSVPADLGLPMARVITTITHVGAFLALALVGIVLDLNWPFALGVAFMGIVLGAQQWLVYTGGAKRALQAFNANLYVGLIMLVAIILQVWIF